MVFSRWSLFIGVAWRSAVKDFLSVFWGIEANMVVWFGKMQKSVTKCMKITLLVTKIADKLNENSLNMSLFMKNVLPNGA